MFSWICPQCGREVPPSLTECPNCKDKPAATPSVTATPAPESAYQRPQPASQQPAASYVARPRRRAGAPTWLLTLGFALAFVGVGIGVYWGIGYVRAGGSSAATQPPATVESPAAKPGAKTSPLQKYIEISGIRFTEDAKKKLEVKFNLTNHSDADINGLMGNVTIWGRTQKSEEDAVGTFSFTADVGPQTTRELTVPLMTKLKVYELPDWQNVTTDLQITAPQ